VNPRELGAIPVEGGTRFTVWAPDAERVDVVVDGDAHELLVHDGGYHTSIVPAVGPGARYRYRLDDGDELADPVSRSQPEGVDGPSQVVDPGAFPWRDERWFGLPLSRYVIYELHVGTFTPEGTFDAAVGRLDDLRELGVTAIEIMPVAEFPGGRNWGYDGVFPWAPQSTYGGPDGLRRLVDEAHARGLAVVLDAVYNHLGPQGNVLGSFGPYFTDAYRTPWGQAMNVDQAGSDDVRRYLIGNALHWFEEYHVDALRLDAVHAIVDTSATPFLAELADAVAAQAERRNRRQYLIAESDLNDPRVIAPRREGGWGLDGQWADDVHHAIHTRLTGERDGYYADFGRPGELARVLRDGYLYTGQHSTVRQRRHGAPPLLAEGRQFVAYAQNHDQVGNRPDASRLGALVDHETAKLAASLVLLSPFVPLLFMGEEYGEPAPFHYFTSHTDPELADAVREGRRAEFASFGALGEYLDPQAQETFDASRLDWSLRTEGDHAALLALHRALLGLRRDEPALAALDRHALEAVEDEQTGLLEIRRTHPGAPTIRCLFALDERPVTLDPPPPGELLLDTADARFGGPGSRWPAAVQPRSAIVIRDDSTN
jgi:maltooligosyltrehalose trehalohydrolase